MPVLLEEYLALTMPITSPYWLNSGPPELPELTVQSVWSRLMAVPSLMEMARSRALTTPVVRVLARVPRALPMEVTLSPTVSWAAVPQDHGGEFGVSGVFDLEHGHIQVLIAAHQFRL